MVGRQGNCIGFGIIATRPNYSHTSTGGGDIRGKRRYSGRRSENGVTSY